MTKLDEFEGMKNFLSKSCVARDWAQEVTPVGRLTMSAGLQVYRRNAIGAYVEAIERACPEIFAALSQEELMELSALLMERVPRSSIEENAFHADLAEATANLFDC